MSIDIYNDPQKKYYVYAWYKPDGTPVYIGKGCGNRAYRKSKWDVQIVASNLSEDVAYAFEKLLIDKLGKKWDNTGILANIADGGKGGNHHCSEETKKKISESLMGKPALKPEGFSETCRDRAIKMKTHLHTKDTWGHRKGCVAANRGDRKYDIEEMRALREKGYTYSQIQDHIGCGYNTVRRYLSK